MGIMEKNVETSLMGYPIYVVPFGFCMAFALGLLLGLPRRYYIGGSRYSIQGYCVLNVKVVQSMSFFALVEP